jgi:hypothetical protein
VLDLDTVVDPPRPRVTLLIKSVQPGQSLSGIRLGNQDDLPQDGQISFFLRTEIPAAFPVPKKSKLQLTTAQPTFF